MIKVPAIEFWKVLVTQPVLLLSSRIARRNNLAPLIWYTPVSSSPPMLGISIKPSSMSYDYIRESGDFVVAVCNAAMARDTHFCGMNSGRDFEKMRYMNLPSKWGTAASPLILPTALANLECRVCSITKTGDRPWIVGEVISVIVEAEYYDDGWLPGTPLLHYEGGHCYRSGNERFEFKEIRPGYAAAENY